jgi:alanine racemase
MSRRARATIDVTAIERNARTLCGHLAPSTKLCAVVKANGYGHGARQAAQASLAGGATWLAVATAHEAAELRQDHADVPILVLGPLDEDGLAIAIDSRAELVAWTPDFVRHISAVASGREMAVHIKLDTGMGRWGARGLAAAVEIATLIEALPALRLTGLMTHFANADETSSDFFDEQLSSFSAVVGELRRAHPHLIVHAANSAATLRDARAHFDMVRCGIALYGLDPYQHDPRDWQLLPALELTSYVAQIALMEPGDSVGYGRAFTALSPTNIATVPIGYADGVRRVLDSSIEVLIGGQRRAVAGNVSMDCLAVDLGTTSDVRVGDEVILIGGSGSERIFAEEVAMKYGTINYEVVCALSERVERSYLGR